MGMTETSNLIAVVANAAATYEVMPRLGVRGDLGLGALLFSGVGGSPFTDYRETDGALTMFHLRLGVSADYALTPNLLATVTPLAFSFSPAHSGLVNTSSLTALDFMVGVGYRM
jgi:hypothetical protein